MDVDSIRVVISKQVVRSPGGGMWPSQKKGFVFAVQSVHTSISVPKESEGLIATESNVAARRDWQSMAGRRIAQTQTYTKPLPVVSPVVNNVKRAESIVQYAPFVLPAFSPMVVAMDTCEDEVVTLQQGTPRAIVPAVITSKPISTEKTHNINYIDLTSE